MMVSMMMMIIDDRTTDVNVPEGRARNSVSRYR